MVAIAPIQNIMPSKLTESSQYYEMAVNDDDTWQMRKSEFSVIPKVKI